MCIHNSLTLSLLLTQVTEMLAYAHDTQHEKIIRGLALGLALVSYGREEGADALFEQVGEQWRCISKYMAACIAAYVHVCAWHGMKPLSILFIK